MFSIKETLKILPDDALGFFKTIFTPSQYNNLLLAFRSKKLTSFRINNLKINRNELLSILKREGIKFTESGILENSFFLNSNENNIHKSDLVKSGKIYIQSISSMIPAVVLNPKSGERVLDLNAAPGSKTTQMADLMNNCGLIDAVEKDFVRMERLKYNAKILNAKIINFYHCDGLDYCNNKDKIYDKVLVDVPCSGEGRFNLYDKASYRDWSYKKVFKLSRLQLKLLKSVIKSVKINGIIIYSTCTLNVIENEAVINQIINCDDFKVEILPIKFQTIREKINSILYYENIKFSDSIKNCLRIMPSARMEGFFVCKMKRLL